MARNRYFEDEIIVEKFNSTMIKRLLGFMRPYSRTLTLVALFMVMMSFVVLIPPYLNRIIIDQILPDDRAPEYVRMAVVVMSIWAAIAVGEVVFNYVRSKVMAKTSYKIVRDLRGSIFSHLQTLSFDYFDNRPAGKILVRVTSYIDELANILSSSVIGFLVDVVKMTVILVFIYILDYRFALIITACIVPLGLVLYYLRAAIHNRLRIARNKGSNRTAFVAENINGITVTKAFNRTQINCDIYADLNNQFNHSWRRVVRLNELFFPAMDIFWNIGVIGIYAAAYYFAAHGTGMSAGKLVSLIAYMGLFSSPLNNISIYVQQLATASSNLERIFETMDTPPSVTDSKNAYDLPEIKGNVEFCNVSFGYEPNKLILKDFNLEVPAGKTIALVGPTGAGKTTVVNLISRFYNLNSGAIKIDGHDIAEVKLHSLRTQVGVMMQDSFIFSGTVLDNIRYARPDATDEECIQAAKKANCDSFIMQLSGGYEHVFSEKGAGLSSGEIQMISFARTILSDPKILILDEATSSIDTQTEASIQEVLNHILVGRTSFIIAHRLSTIKKADCILYIANQGIAEAGTHDELMERRGLYYELQA